VCRNSGKIAVTCEKMNLTKQEFPHRIKLIVPGTPLNNADHAGSFYIKGGITLGAGEKNPKEHQPTMNLDEQIANLRDKGLIIKDEAYARNILRDISYFRLIKAYSLGLKVKNGDYYKNIQFEDVVQLYLFDTDFRQSIFPQIEKFEISLRCRTANYFSDKYGILGYEDKNNFNASDEVFSDLFDEITKEISRKSRTPFIKNFKENYVSGKIPLYALVEVMSFGTLSKFYKNMKNEDKKAISSEYNVSYSYFESWIENLSYVRNICAHYSRLYNAKMTKTPRIYKQYASLGISNSRIFATLLSLKHLLPNDRHWDDFTQTIELLTEKYASVKLHCIGFPQNWKDVLCGT
jgi:abortive infection bacteriophage resistance protein